MMPELDDGPCAKSIRLSGDEENDFRTSSVNGYYYLPSEQAKPAVSGPSPPICKDFQSKFCARSKCKYLHLTIEEASEYNKTGKLPPHGGRPDNSSSSISKDFLHRSDATVKLKNKRSILEYIDDGSLNEPGSKKLISENESLLDEIEKVQRQLDSLRQTNDTLFEQNTRYRAQINGKIPPDIAASVPLSVPTTSLIPSTKNYKSLLPLEEAPSSSSSYTENSLPTHNSQEAYSQYYTQVAQYSQNSNPVDPWYQYQQQCKQYEQQQQAYAAYMEANPAAAAAAANTAAAAPPASLSSTDQSLAYQQYYQQYYGTQYWNTYPSYG